MPDFDHSIGYLLNIAALVNKNTLHTVLLPLDITPEQYILLLKLYHLNGQGQKQLAHASCKDEANITRILKHLEKKGLIERLSDARDKRNNLVYITKNGCALIEESKPHIDEYRQEMFASFSKEELSCVKRVLEKIISQNR